MEDDDPYNGKVLLAAVICLTAVVLFVLLLHAYGRWLLRRSRAPSELHLPRRSAEAVGFSAGRALISGLDAKAVAALPEFVCRGTEGGTVDCVVCLSSMDEGERGRILPRCGHGFHACCIDAWLTAQSNCPICRAAVAAEEPEEVVVVVEYSDGVLGATREHDEVVAEIMSVGGGQESSSSSSSTATAAAAAAAAAAEEEEEVAAQSFSVDGCSLKRMLSKSRSDNRVFPTA